MKTTQRLVLVLIALITIHTSKAQVFNLEENKTETHNGFEYGFTIVNEQIKDNYSRYEIKLYVINKSGCTKLYAEKQDATSSKDNNKLANLECTNATGKRLTNKKGNLDLKPFYVYIKNGINNETKSVKAGFVFRNGETITNKIIVIVPLNERPKITCTVNSLIDL
jgi:hypothetical protein